MALYGPSTEPIQARIVKPGFSEGCEHPPGPPSDDPERLNLEMGRSGFAPRSDVVGYGGAESG
jgi:hypothetical protein